MISSDKIIQAARWLDKYRKKIIFMLLLPVIVSCGTYAFSDYIIEVLVKPLKGMNLFFLTPMDGIMAKVKIAIFTGIILTIPIIAYIVVSLAASKLHKKTKRIIRFVIIPFATFSFLGGVLFGYKFVIPSTIEFLISCGNDFMSATLRGSDYFSFITLLLISIGLVFELPLVLVALSRTGFLTSRMLMKRRKIAIILIIVFVALITPTPDIFTLMIVSLPMIILFETSIWWIFLLEKGDRKVIRGGI
ncbi:twin-arginine translocase subunit TatC [Clostridium sp. CX1]|uniref:twin-arginine translocase subunit TatC n=1 Tax=Clostridium sp. CX1 TaxID=2978346 RepID=UPI0021BE5024|nr:twin-arginine translocase subunit TatC [Clostridium sp. CX1]MCT8976683.1 twin-arginine translocase subunit TatC [Clostridium sp. CX1]